MARKPDPPSRPVLPPEEAEFWAKVVRDARPLPGQRPPPGTAKAADAPRPAAARGTAADGGEAARRAAERPPPPRQEQHQAPLATPPRGAIPGLDRRSAERLREGRMEIDGRLDLHGMTQAAAHGALQRFVLRGHERGLRCLLIITGKGNTRTAPDGSVAERAGVLRQAVPRWLAAADIRKLILAVQPARPQHGGGGALYVLLKRKRGETPGQ